MDGTSDHPLTNRAAVAEFLRLQNLITQVQSTTATTSRRGLAQLSTATSITDVNAYALSATEKNASITGSLASQIQTLQSNLNNRGRFHWASSGNTPVTITQAHTHISLIELTSLPIGTYLVMGITYCNDSNVFTVTGIKQNGKVHNFITNAAHDGVYDTMKQVFSIVSITSSSDILSLFLEVNKVNTGRTCTGTLEAIRVN